MIHCISALAAAAVAAVLLPNPAARGEEPLPAAVAEFMKARSPAAGRSAADRILALNPDAAEVEKLLSAGIEYGPAPSNGWSVRTRKCADGVERPWHLFVPQGYSPLRKHPVFFFLHGGVSRPEVVDPEEFAPMRGFLEKEMESEGIIHVLPETSRGAEWWTDAGSAYILGIIDELKADYNVDENRVYVSGFSDGGSGSYYLALFHATPFAAFIPLNGHIAVAQAAGGKPVFLPALASKPLYAVNTGQDRLYPAAQVKPFIDRMIEAGAKITYRVYENIGHQLAYGDEEKPKILEFMKTNPRAPHPARITVETASLPAGGRCHWVRAEELGETASFYPFPDWNVVMAPSRVMLGVTVDQNFEGPGVKIAEVMKESVAEAMGMKPGDVIVGIDESRIADFQSLAAALGRKKFGDRIAVKIDRGPEGMTLDGAFPQAKARAVFVRGPQSGRIDAEAKGNRVDAKTYGVRRFTLLVSTAMFDLGSDIEVFANGDRVFRGRVRPDVAFMLEAAAADRDRTMVYAGKIEIVLEPATEGEEF